MIRWACPYCDADLSREDDDAGRRIDCWNCKAMLIVPRSLNVESDVPSCWHRPIRRRRKRLLWLPFVIALVLLGCGSARLVVKGSEEAHDIQARVASIRGDPDARDAHELARRTARSDRQAHGALLIGFGAIAFVAGIVRIAMK